MPIRLNAMNLIKTIDTPNPKRDSHILVACLGADKGIRAKVKQWRQGWLVTAEGKSVYFRDPTEKADPVTGLTPSDRRGLAKHNICPTDL